jgi:6-phosphofructokinase 1
MENPKGKLGILVGGEHSPGINSAISAATIEAVNRGLEVVGIYDGFAGLIDGSPEKVRELSISDVSRIHNQGGSILRTSRANPTRSPEDLERCVANLKSMGIADLVSIGGDDTAFSAYAVSRAAAGALHVVHVPKTIDNDLPLPANMPTFGHEPLATLARIS